MLIRTVDKKKLTNHDHHQQICQHAFVNNIHNVKKVSKNHTRKRLQIHTWKTLLNYIKVNLILRQNLKRYGVHIVFTHRTGRQC